MSPAALQFEPAHLKWGKLGAEPVRQPLVDMIATQYLIDRRFVHVRIVADVDALANEAGFWGMPLPAPRNIRQFFNELETHPTITICKGDVETRRALIEG